jgi:hypothetical protein
VQNPQIKIKIYLKSLNINLNIDDFKKKACLSTKISFLGMAKMYIIKIYEESILIPDMGEIMSGTWFQLS